LFAFRKEVIHTALYVVYAIQIDVFSKQIREIKVHKSVNSSRVRNPRKVFSSLAGIWQFEPSDRAISGSFARGSCRLVSRDRNAALALAAVLSEAREAGCSSHARVW
jgi:hypothetical protein